MSRWRVVGPYGERTAPSWPRAVDMLCQDLKTTWMRTGEMGGRAAELQAWAEVEMLEPYEPCEVIACGQRHEIKPAS